MIPFSFFLIKPDAVRRRLLGKILAVIEAEGFEVTKMKMVAAAERSDVLAHYSEHAGREYFKSLVDTLIGQRLVAGTVVFTALPEETVERFRTLVGSYSAPRAGTLRSRFALSERENAVHSSDSGEAAMREHLLWFPADSD